MSKPKSPPDVTTPPIPPTAAELLIALRAILPYAENESSALQETARRDNEEVGQGEALSAVRLAQSVIAQQEVYEKYLSLSIVGGPNTTIQQQHHETFASTKK